MGAWTVVQTDEFRARLKEEHTKRRDRLAASVAQPEAAASALHEYDEFAAFAKRLLGVTEGTIDAGSALKLSPLGTGYSHIAVLTHGKWQATFLVDRERRTCTAIAIDRVRPTVERFKNFLRRPLG